MEYFDFATPADTAACEDAECPCPRDPVEAGSGYLFISNQVVRQRRDNPEEASASPILLCRDAARRRDLDLEIAAEDAAHWWATGSVALRTTPRRELKFREFKAASIAEAEALAREALGTELIGTDVVKDVRDASITAQGRTADEAVATVMTRIPADAFGAQAAEVVQEGQTGEVEVTEREEADAKRSWRKSAPRGAQLEDLTCKQPPKNGIIGMGKRPGTWVASWSAPFIAEVFYKMPAIVSARYFP